MAKERAVYDDTNSKKTVGLVVKTATGMLQFPEGVTYAFENIDGTSFCVVSNTAGAKIAHVKVACMESVHGPATLFRDGRWK